MRFFIIFISLVLFGVLSGCATTKNFVEKAAITDAKLGFPGFTQHVPTSTVTIDHTSFDNFLQTYLVATSENSSAQGANLIRYGAVSQQDQSRLIDYIDQLQATQVSTLNRDEQLAFWINLYNAQTVRIVLENYPVDSIRSIKSSPFDFKGPWNDTRLNVEGIDLSLDNIENKIIRPVFNDPRIHYGVNCAAIGCPNLRASAYRGKDINTALDQQARAFINNPRGVSVSDGHVIASRIFLWYRKDYGDTEGDVLNHIREYANPDLREDLEGVSTIKSYEYDWALNRI